MRLGIFAKTFPGSTPSVVLAAAKRAGYESVQYNMACSGLDSLPLFVGEKIADEIRAASAETGVAIASVSATYNIIHPDREQREQGRRAFTAIAAAAQRMGTRLLTVCTGTCDPHDQWTFHPDNATEHSWRELCAEFEKLIPIADQYDVRIGVEPELANVVSSAPSARRLLDTFGNSRIGIVLDAANLFEVADRGERHRLVEEAVDLLGDSIALAHAKDRRRDGRFATAGTGVLDYRHYLATLRRSGFDGDLVTHGLSAGEAPEVAGFLRGSLSDAPVMVFQHGLCGDASQPASLFPEDIGWRRVTVESRGHGRAEAGPPEQFSIATFADDLAAWIEDHEPRPVVVGGVSMGAAIALRLAALRPDLVRALVLSRPAWIAEAAPPNLAPNALVGELLRSYPPEEAHSRFEASELGQRIAREAPDNLASLLGFFSQEPVAVTRELLCRIANDGPGITREQIRGLRQPTLVVATARDYIHPLALAHELSSLIPNAKLVEITAKADDRVAHERQFRHALAQFLEHL